MTLRLSNRDKARLAVARLEAEIAARRAVGETLPLNGRALHIGLICQTVGVSRSTAHQNPAFRAVLAAYAEAEGLCTASVTPGGEPEWTTVKVAPDMVPAARLRQEERRAEAAEKRIAELVARNAALAARLRRLQAAEDELLAAGRRHRPIRIMTETDDRTGTLDLASLGGCAV